MWGLVVLLYMVGFFQRVAPAVMAQELMSDFQLGGALDAVRFRQFDRVGSRRPWGTEITPSAAVSAARIVHRAEIAQNQRHIKRFVAAGAPRAPLLLNGVGHPYRIGLKIAGRR